VGIAERFGLKIVAIKDLVAYRMRTERLVKKELSISLNTRFGTFEVSAYSQATSGDVHLAVHKGNWSPDEPVLVRVHSASETSDLLGMLFYDEGLQLQKAVERIASEGKGVLLIMRHGEKEELSILETLQKLSEANTEESHPWRPEMSQRDFGVGAQILRDLGICRMRLMTNSPKKRVGLTGYGLEVVDNVPF
jgi:3,4-dihydroxy 2-butanone 4-phosphate synthase/GTP cyclohydrolase II